MHRYEVLLKPLKSEKVDRLGDEHNQYAFVVAKEANKVQIKEAVEGIFRVNVTLVRTLVMRGKTRRAGRHLRTQAAWKKAIVTLKKGERIDLT